MLENSETEALILKHARVKPILFRGRDLGAMARESDSISLQANWLERAQGARGTCPRLVSFADASIDAGSHEIWARSILPSFGASSFIGSGNWGGMGYALPGLIGAKIAAPRRRAVAITGDGCLLMSLADLCTLAGVRGPAILVVMNNAMYGEIRRVQLEQFGAHTQFDIPALDFAAIARSFGLKGIRIEKEKDLGRGFGDALSSSRPVESILPAALTSRSPPSHSRMGQ